MTAIYPISFSVDQLNEVVAKVGFYHFRNFQRLQFEGSGLKFGNHISTSKIAQVAALPSTSILRIQTGGSGKAGFTGNHVFPYFFQLIDGVQPLFIRNLGIENNLRNFVFRIEQRKTIYRNILKICPNLLRTYRYSSRYFFLHFFSEDFFPFLFFEFFFDFESGFAVKLLQLFRPPHHLSKIANFSIQTLLHFFILQRKRIEFGLTNHHFAKHQLVQQCTPNRVGDLLILRYHAPDFLFKIRL